jgi:phosphatidate cytidylyltransferase
VTTQSRPTKAAPSPFLQRALVSLTLGPLALYLIYLGGWFYFVPLTAVMVVATIEYSHLTARLGWQTPAWLLAPAVAVLLTVAQWADTAAFAPTFLVSLLLVLVYTLWRYERRRSQTAVAEWLAMSLGLLLLGWVGSHFFYLRRLEPMAWQWTMLVMSSAWLTDSAAYVVGKFMAGRFFGRHQLTPRLSPNKTVEGYIGGIVLGTALTVAIAAMLRLPLGAALILGIAISVLSVLGDLAISLLKREAGVKDSGALFPGHGGALDRIDSLVWAVAIAYYLLPLVR